jgi:hypothetical protein
MFGYDKGEMDGKNVSVLMPAPFNQVHRPGMSAAAAPHVATQRP